MKSRTIDPKRTLGALVADQPGLAPVFDRLGLDYCCGGNRTLADACRRRGLDPGTVAVLVAELGAPPTAGFAAHDVARATVGELCDHVVSAHHDRLRREVPRIEELLATVVRVHGKEHAELHDLERLFRGVAGGLLEHVEREEETLFPAARAAAAAGRFDPRLADLVAEHTQEHSATGDALVALRELAGGYDAGEAYCSTHRALLEGLEAFELDLHQHVHEENNLLFPRLLAVSES